MHKALKIFGIIFILGIISFLIVPGFVFGEVEYQIDNSYTVNKQIKDLNDEISGRKNKIQKMQEMQKEYADKIEQKQNEKASLNNQLDILENRVAKIELDIELVETDIERVKLEIQKTDLEIEEKNQAIEKEKKHIKDVLSLIYKRDNVSELEVILLNDSLSDFLSQVKYLEDINENIEESLEGLKKLKRQMEKERITLESQNKDLKELKEELNQQIKKLDNEKNTKIYVIDQVNRSEKEYQRLLDQAKSEQEEAAAEIVSMEKLVRAKIAELEGKKLEFNDKGFIWPVTKNVVTAYFHDPEYPFRYIFEHPGVDIRAAHGSSLKAAASGYVARTVRGIDGSYGYIMIVHGDGLSTVYGHVSDIYVKEDDYVVQGQSIGKTGGLPGTAGAGRLTTGPHLHFEIRLNGIPVDPLGYLP